MKRAIFFSLITWCVESVAIAKVRLPPKAVTMREILAASNPEDWRPLDPNRTLYLELSSGRVVIELAPEQAPNHVANIEALTREKYFDGLAILRAQDNYVVQWGDPKADDKAKRRPIVRAKPMLKAEFVRPSSGMPFTPLDDRDTYAPEVGFSNGFPAARDAKSNQAWLTHCYGMVGAGRDEDADSGGGTELYVVIGHAPRHLDRNVTLVGRVVSGIELLSTMPRGGGAMGFYEQEKDRLPILSVKVAADLPENERSHLELMRTDTPTFAKLIESRRNRKESWYKVQAGHIEICNVPLPVRVKAQLAPKP